MSSITKKLKTFLESLGGSKPANENKNNNYFKNNMAWPVGHFYSPLPLIDEIRKEEEKVFYTPHEIPGVDLNTQEQFQMLKNLKTFYTDVPFTPTKQNELRYFYHNPNFSYGEAIILFCMIRFLKPKHIIEIGAGYTSCAMIDTNELFFENQIDITILEPYPEFFLTLIKNEPKKNYKLLPDKVQNINRDVFASLKSNDILFIDSSHVSKVNSDVNYLFFEILPELNKGVYIHFHDIYYPFEYPKEWIYKGVAWNEAYMLKSFLQFNSSFRVKIFNSYLSTFYKDFFLESMPLFLKNPGSSIWLSKEN